MSVLSLANGVVPSRYELELELDHQKANFRGQLIAQLHAVAGCTELKEFSLHGDGLIVLSANIGNVKLKVSYDRRGRKIDFAAESPIDLSSGTVAPLALAYVGTVHAIKTFQEPTRGVFKTNFMRYDTGKSDNFVIATHAQPGFARMIFPCIDEPNHKAQFQLTITSDQRFKVISNTAQLTEHELDNSRRSVKFGVTPSMTPSLFGFVVGDLEFIQSTVKLPQGNLPIRFYAPQQIEHAAFGLDTVQKAFPALQSYFQCDYPVNKLDFVLLPFLTDMAMENFGMITVQQDNLLLSPTALADKSVQTQVKQLIVHEMVHQWMGNYISFDSWEHLWFNESFATWCACEILDAIDQTEYYYSDEYLHQLDVCLRGDSELSSQSIAASSKKDGIIQTSEAVDPHNYAKGISLIRSLSCCIGEDIFKKALQKVFAAHEFHDKSIKPSDIWSYMGKELHSSNISNYMYSWVQTPGIPILHVTSNGSLTSLVQHRFVSSGETDHEDVPYHIPLFMKLTDGSLDQKQVLLTDRSTTIDYPILLCNSDAKGYYRVSYESQECYELLKKGLEEGLVSGTDLYKFFQDLKYFIGNEAYQKQEHLDGVLDVLRYIAQKISLEKSPQLYRGLGVGLEILQTIELSVIAYRGDAENLNILETVIMPLFKQITWPSQFENVKYGSAQLQLMSQVLFAAKDTSEAHEVATRYFKKVMQGPNASIPSEIVGSVFATISQHTSSIKNWKKLNELVKSSAAVAPHVSNASPVDLQNAAIENLSFSTDPAVVTKILNFVMTNIDSSSIEKALFGLAYNAHRDSGNSKVRDSVWTWFNLHYDMWAKKSFRDGSDTSSRLKKTLTSISIIVFEMWLDKPEQIDTFVTMKQSKFGQLSNVQEIWNSLKKGQLKKMKIYQGILGF